MLKFQVRTLGRERRRQSTPLRDVFNGTSSAASSSSNDTASSASGHHHHHHPGGGSTSAPNSPWHDLSRSRGRSTSVSSLSSASTSSDTPPAGQECTTIRVYTSSVRPDTDYKTLFANGSTSAGELIRMVLNKFRIHFKDPDLFYLMMELTTKHEASDVRHSVALDTGAKPLVLQACYPSERVRFVLHIRQTFQVRIYDSSVFATSNYKTLIVTQQTTCAEAVRMVMKTAREPAVSSSSSSSSSSSTTVLYLDNNGDMGIGGGARESRRIGSSEYALALVDLLSRTETMLHAEECLFNVLYETPGTGQYQIHLRPSRRPRRYDTSIPSRVSPPTGFVDIDNDEQRSSSLMNNNYYRRRKTTTTTVPLYSDEDYAISGLSSRLLDQVL